MTLLMSDLIHDSHFLTAALCQWDALAVCSDNAHLAVCDKVCDASVITVVVSVPSLVGRNDPQSMRKAAIYSRRRSSWVI